MKLIIVHIADIALCPPVINLVNVLGDLNIETTVITTKSKSFTADLRPGIKTIYIDLDYEAPRTLLEKFKDMNSTRSELWRLIGELYDEETCIWVTSDTALKHLGNRVIEYSFVLQQMELAENLEYYSKLPFIKMDAEKIGNSALAVVVPEYNRAHITKAWWNLKETPLILTNKPYISREYQRNESIDNPDARALIEKLHDKKIVLYQGIIHKERPLDKYIRAVEKLGDEYAFVVMSGGKDEYSQLGGKNYYFIPFIAPPQHLEVTSHAHIGVLSYFPTKSSQYSILNAVFCAPNKTFEYAMFGVPMIGNDNPGLRSIIDRYAAGKCLTDFTEESICSAIQGIELNYRAMSDNAIKYFHSINSVDEVKSILSIIERRMNARKD